MPMPSELRNKNCLRITKVIFVNHSKQAYMTSDSSQKINTLDNEIIITI